LVESVTVSCGTSRPGSDVVDIAGRLTALLEHVPKKLLDFFDKGMLNLFEFERFLFDHMIPRDREALLGAPAYRNGAKGVSGKGVAEEGLEPQTRGL
jgi:hypothetical protein